MSDIRLQKKIRKTLEDNSFTVTNNLTTPEKFVLVSNFGKELSPSSFYIDKPADSDNLIIGAHVSLDTKLLTKSLIHKIQYVASRFNVSCAPVKYDEALEQGTLSLQMVYKFVKYNEDDFILYVQTFKLCIKTLQDDVQKYLSHQDYIYLDLSMFEGADWEEFDPYTYILERDKTHDGSWERYAAALKKQLRSKETLIELLYVEMCHQFEVRNRVPIDVACQYIIDRIMQAAASDTPERALN